MPYPHIVINRTVRRGIMIGLIVLFCILAPAILFYTAGYRYDITEQRLKPTGVISLSFEPGDAVVTLNTTVLSRPRALRFNQEAPLNYYLKNRAPGTYHVRIEKVGYKTWEETIQVESNKTTYLGNIVLFPNVLPEKIDLPIDITGIPDTAPDGEYLGLISESNRLIDISLLQSPRQTIIPLARYTSSTPSLSWSGVSPVGLLLVTTSRAIELQLFVHRDNLQTRIYTFPLESSIKTWQWSASSVVPGVYVQIENAIIRLTDTVSTTIGTVSSSIWYVDRDEVLWEWSTSTERLQSKTVPLDERTDITLGRPLSQIIDFNHLRLISKHGNDVTITELDTDAAASFYTIEGVETMHYRKESDEWFFTTSREIWRVNAKGRVSLVNRFSDKIISIGFLPRFHSLVYATENGIFAFHETLPQQVPLFTSGMIQTFAVDEKNSIIYFLGTIGSASNLFALPLIP